MIGWMGPEREPTLDELLADEMMAPVMRSAGIDKISLRLSLIEAARRLCPAQLTRAAERAGG
jgi:hypothetical protein